LPPPAGTPWHNGAYVAREVRIADARRARERPSLEREGFELRLAPSAVASFDDEDEVRRVYYAEAAELALAATGATSAYVFDHLVRKREADRPALGFGRRGGARPAANGRVHNDYTERSGRTRFEQVVPPEGRRVDRFAIVNLWRSARGPILDTPLALCDARSVSAEDLVAGDVHYRDRTGEIYYVAHSARHRWCYFPEMDRDEVLVFKQYDSRVNGAARFTPHAAFDLPDVPADAPLRESIEVRCVVTWG
jgi:hypothetical protein